MLAQELETAFQEMLPTCAVVAVGVSSRFDNGELPTELSNARRERQREFRAGRWCAQNALARLGVDGSVGRRPDRGPSWPAGVAGSISHAENLAVAVVGRLQRIGIDFEQTVTAQALDDLRQDTIDDAEWKLVGQSIELATAVFSAKESIFKCEYPHTGNWLEFSDAKLVSVSDAFLTFNVKGRSLQAQYRLLDGFSLTAVTVK